MNRIDQQKMLEGCLYNTHFHGTPSGALLDFIQQVKDLSHASDFVIVCDEYHRLEVTERATGKPVAILLSI